jgi:hypothetical protein
MIKSVKSIDGYYPIATMKAEPHKLSQSMNTAVRVFGTLAHIVYCKGCLYVLSKEDFMEVTR